MQDIEPISLVWLQQTLEKIGYFDALGFVFHVEYSGWSEAEMQELQSHPKSPGIFSEVHCGPTGAFLSQYFVHLMKI